MSAPQRYGGRAAEAKLLQHEWYREDICPVSWSILDRGAFFVFADDRKKKLTYKEGKKTWQKITPNR